MLLLSLFIVSYLVANRPYEGLFFNVVEIFNQLFVYFSGIVVMICTDLVDFRLRDRISDMYFTSILTVIIINVCLVLLMMIYQGLRKV